MANRGKWKVPRLIVLVYLVILLGVGMQVVKRWPVYPPDLPGHFLIRTTDDQLVVLSGDGKMEDVFEVPGLGTGDAQWLSDQHSIAFSKNEDRRALYVLDVSTGVVQQFDIFDTNSNSRIEIFSWSPLGDTIAFIAESGTQEGVYLYTFQDSAIRKISDCHSNCGSISWSHDGKELIFLDIERPETTPSSMTRIVSFDLETQDRSILFTASGAFESMAWSSDQVRLALVDYTQGLFISDRMGNLQKLIDSVGSVVWSPDDKWIAYTGVDRRTNAYVYVYDFESGEFYQVYPRPSLFSETFPDEGRNFVFDWQ